MDSFNDIHAMLEQVPGLASSIGRKKHGFRAPCYTAQGRDSIEAKGHT
jgi:hypothetical protein